MSAWCHQPRWSAAEVLLKPTIVAVALRSASAWSGVSLKTLLRWRSSVLLRWDGAMRGVRPMRPMLSGTSPFMQASAEELGHAAHLGGRRVRAHALHAGLDQPLA